MFLVGAIAASAQAPTPLVFGLNHGETSLLDVGVNYAFIHANAPPGQCGCFSINGGSGTIAYNFSKDWSAVVDISGGHVNSVSGTVQNITIIDYLAGARYSYRTSHRFTPYGQVLVGGSTEGSNYAFVQSAGAFAASAGGGLTIGLSRRFGWNAVQADYIYSKLPNAGNNDQNDLRVASGFYFRIGPR
jgi:peptidoglycan-associated lipoprotein